MTTTTKDNLATAYSTIVTLARVAEANELKAIYSIDSDNGGQVFFSIPGLEGPACGHFLRGIETIDQEDFDTLADAFGADWTAFMEGRITARDQRIAQLRAELERLEGGR